MRHLVIAALAALFAFSGPGAVQAHKTGAKPEAASADRPATDPGLRHGVLPNGLEYYIVVHRTPARTAAIRMHVRVGSYMESDEERGAAHFLEHMAFNGTRNFPENSLDGRFGRAGVAFGRDQNAGTGLFGTTYELDLPEIDQAKLDLAFRWLRDVADGALLDPEAVRRERGVIRAEDDRTRGPEREVSERIQRFIGKGFRATERDPIGRRETVEAMTSAQLRGFYERWYRPDRTVLVIAADAPVEDMEAYVRKHFSDWTAKAAAPREVTPAPFSPVPGVQVLTDGGPSLPTITEVCHLIPPRVRGAETAGRERARQIQRMWRDILNERLQILATGATPPFVSAQIASREIEREAGLTCLDVLPVKGAWREGLKAANAELLRFARFGPSEREVAHARDVVLAEYRGRAQQEAALEAAWRAESILERVLEGGSIATPSERYRFVERAGAGVRPAEVRDAFVESWRGGGPYLVVLDPKPPTPSEALNAWAEAQGQVVEAAPERVQTPEAWAYSSFGPPSPPVRREDIENPGFSRFFFANGVVLNFKSLKTAGQQVKVRVRFGAGRREIAKGDYYAAQIGAGMFLDGGLGRHDAETVKRLFADYGWGLQLAITNEAFVLSGSTNANDADTQLQIMAAYVSDPGFRRTLDARLPTTMEMVQRSTEASAEYALFRAVNQTIAPDGAYLPPSPEKLLRLGAADFERIFRPALTQAPLEVTVVGDITEERALSLVGRTFGAMPTRLASARARPDTWFLRYPDHPIAPIFAEYDGGDGKALVTVTWPLYVAEPARRREEYALLVLTGILNAEVRHRVREALGAAYAPEVTMDTPDKADQGSIQASVETTAAGVAEVVRAVRAAAQRLASGDIDQADFDAAKAPALAAGATRLDDIDWWISGLDGSWSEPEILREFVGWQADFGSVTLEDVRGVARHWLRREPIVAVAQPRGSPAIVLGPSPDRPAESVAPPPRPSPRSPRPKAAHARSGKT